MQTNCQHCGQQYEVDSASTGRTATCEACGKEITVEDALKNRVVWAGKPLKRAFLGWYFGGIFMSLVSIMLLALLVNVAANNHNGNDTAGVIGCGVILCLAAVVAVLALVYPYLLSRTTSYTITGEEVITQSGILERKKNTVRISDVRSITTVQSFSNLLTRVGGVVVSTAGTDMAGTKPLIYGVKDFAKVESLIQHLRKS